MYLYDPTYVQQRLSTYHQQLRRGQLAANAGILFRVVFAVAYCSCADKLHAIQMALAKIAGQSA